MVSLHSGAAKAQLGGGGRVSCSSRAEGWERDGKGKGGIEGTAVGSPGQSCPGPKKSQNCPQNVGREGKAGAFHIGNGKG